MMEIIVPALNLKKWGLNSEGYGTHSDPQHFETEEKLRNHIIQHDTNSCKRSISGDTIYICPWKGCNKHQSSIIKLEQHLRQHTQQKPFKCPICNRLRFGSPDALSQHLIMNHNDSFVDSDTDDENEKLNLGKVEDKNDARVKEEEESMKIKTKRKRPWVRNYLIITESPVSEYDSENENYDDLPDAPRGPKLTEIESDRLMLKAVGEFYKDTEAGKYFSKAFEIMEDGFFEHRYVIIWSHLQQKFLKYHYQSFKILINLLHLSII
ncbi:transcription factor Sp9-like [Rhizophagus clarus]|uniref:Transcription factor Sp9-like n=1 Tax=Rhizophagus clarus TaxID=94130 RepID=A0A8H3QHD8_9GLOM|nr:transcription factor Sp9-like [Rhizophagus clarus]